MSLEWPPTFFHSQASKGSLIVMGVSGDSHPGLLLLSHLAGVLGFAAGLWLYLENLQLRRQLSELQEEVADIRAHSSNPRQRPAQSRGWDPAEPPPGTWTGKGLGSEGLETVVRDKRQDFSGNLVQIFFVAFLLVVLVLLVHLVRRVCFRKEVIEVEAGGSSPPHQIPELARRQLAEIRLRKNGFGR